MFTPSVLAASWFNENQRTLANSIASISNPLGVLIAFNTSPFLLKSPDDMMILHAVNLCPIGMVNNLNIITSDIKNSSKQNNN